MKDELGALPSGHTCTGVGRKEGAWGGGVARGLGWLTREGLEGSEAGFCGRGGIKGRNAEFFLSL